MKSNSTFVIKALLAIVVFSLILLAAKSQCVAPAMVWQNASLTSPAATAGNVGATYKFPNVVSGVYAKVTITAVVGGATLTSIDDMTFGYSAAWQPVVKTPTVQGASDSYVSFQVEFFNTSDNSDHKFDCAQLSFIDVDGDGQHVKEYVGVRNYSTYTVASNTVLTLSNINQGSGTLLKAVGTYVNYAGLDTASYKTNINFNFSDIKKIDEVRIGSITDASFTVQDRYSCGYFKMITMPFAAPLPVKYLSFDGAVSAKTVLLNWVTVSEINNNYYEVERSFDGSNFKSIAMVMDALDVVGDKKTYKAKDNSVELQGKTVVYYRLKQVDKDGKYSYSTILAMKLQSQQNDNVKMTVAPNPFTEKVTLRFEATESGVAEMRIMNVSGQKAFSKQSIIVKGYNNLQIDGLSKLSPGLYVVQLLLNGNVISNQKIVKD